jgi:hypothetical protein
MPSPPPYSDNELRAAVLTDRGMKVTRSKRGSTRPNVAAVAMVRAIAMAMQEPPRPIDRSVRSW